MNKPILYIHAGLFKTGTTSIQNFLSINYETLLNNSILYPKTGRDELAQHHYFFSSMRVPEHHYFLPKKKYAEYLDDLQNEIFTHKPKKVILSSEIFCDFDSQETSVLKEKLNALSSLFSTVKVLFYLRRPDHYSISLNNTEIWYGARKIHQLTYPKILNWTRVIEKEQLIFRPFEKNQFFEGDLYHDFLFAVDIVKKEGFIFPEINLNESIEDDIIELMRIINNSHYDISQNNKFKYQLLEAFPKGGKVKNAFFSPKDRLDIIKLYEDDIQTIAREYLGRDDGILFYEPLPDLNEPWEPYKGLPVETIVKAFGYLFFKQQEQLEIQNTRLKKNENQLNKRNDNIFTKKIVSRFHYFTKKLRSFILNLKTVILIVTIFIPFPLGEPLEYLIM